MIGGFIFRQENMDLAKKLTAVLDESFKTISCGERGFLFYDDPYQDFPTSFHVSDRITVLTQDLLVRRNAHGNYVQTDIDKDLAESLINRNTEVYNEIVSDFRLIVLEHTGTELKLYLLSNRAGNGRMYYSYIDSGILFASDIRFLLKILPLQVNDTALYAILKYGAVPEPMTISHNISAVPAAHYLSYAIANGQKQTIPYFQFEFPCDHQPVADNIDPILQPVREKLVKSAQFIGKYKPAILISGGIDSSLYASYLNQVSDEPFHGINCTFGDDDLEFPFAQALADKLRCHFHVGRMAEKDALNILNDTVKLTGHPYSDFSVLPIVFILKFMKNHIKDTHMLIEGNGGDDCFGFPDLATQNKFMLKSRFPGILKILVASAFKESSSWKIESQHKFLAGILALSDVHEIIPKNYFLTLTPVNFLGLNRYKSLDQQVSQVMEDIFSVFAKDFKHLSYEANITIRQLMHVNSRRWAAKAHSVGESLGIRVIYPYIWKDILLEQGRIPWTLKINNGVVKWPLKHLLEEFMPEDFIYRKKSGFVPPFKRWLTSESFNHLIRDILLSADSNVTRLVSPKIIDDLLDYALQGKNLRHAILNFLWGALFTEMWIKTYQSN